LWAEQCLLSGWAGRGICDFRCSSPPRSNNTHLDTYSGIKHMDLYLWHCTALSCSCNTRQGMFLGMVYTLCLQAHCRPLGCNIQLHMRCRACILCCRFLSKAGSDKNPSDKGCNYHISHPGCTGTTRSDTARTDSNSGCKPRQMWRYTNPTDTYQVGRYTFGRWRPEWCCTPDTASSPVGTCTRGRQCRQWLCRLLKKACLLGMPSTACIACCRCH
jgi:hypothetical protein